ncbi:uncharacterized protein ARMOST_03095 [Armillaria ostoyae]|uniref:Uncharacterized protein n=1 Tax=Armillaria ostoyae TaxID=47428 RepID=A0A284QTH4_ARMOS|nr:uncharacterized protein ARMOST_03095 [Armillaria ostoyae]
MASHVRAADPAVPYWDLVPVPIPIPIPHVSAIYPTLIITFVCVGSTLDVSIQTFHQSRPSQQFRSLTDLRPSVSSPIFATRIEMSEASVS